MVYAPWKNAESAKIGRNWKGGIFANATPFGNRHRARTLLKMKIWNEEVRMRVIHPDGTSTTDVMAYTIFDAKLQAAARWDLTPEQLRQCKVMVDTAKLSCCREA